MTERPVGRIAGLFGVRGELKCDPTSSGRALFVPGAALRCEGNGVAEVVHIECVREHKGRLLIALDEAQDTDEAERFVGVTFYAERAVLDVGEGEYLDVDLIGCMVRSESGFDYGTVQRVDHFPGSDMLIVNGRMLPMVKAFIRSIDTSAKCVTVDVPSGLLDDDAVIDA